MPELDGLEATRQITADPTLTGTRVLVLTTFELDEYVFGALRAGASGFLLKGGEPASCSPQYASSPQANRCSRRASPSASSSAFAQPDSAARASRRARRAQPTRARSSATRRARTHQPRNRRPARPQSLTVKTHVSRILTKLRARDRVQLVVIAYQTGIANSQQAMPTREP